MAKQQTVTHREHQLTGVDLLWLSPVFAFILLLLLVSAIGNFGVIPGILSTAAFVGFILAALAVGWRITR